VKSVNSVNSVKQASFSYQTDLWFDDISKWAENNPKYAAELLKKASRSTTKKQLKKFLDLLLVIERAFLNGKCQSKFNEQWSPALVSLYAHGFMVLNKEFQQEFRYSFGHQVSAAGEYFSLVQQALSYNFLRVENLTALALG